MEKLQTPPTAGAYCAEEDEIGLFELWENLVSEWKTVALTTGIVIALALGYVLIATPSYETKAIVIKPYDDQVADLKLLPSVSASSDTLYKEFRNRLTSYAIIQAVLQQPNYKQALIRLYQFKDPDKQTLEIEHLLRENLQFTFPANDKKEAKLKEELELLNRFNGTEVTLDLADPKLSTELIKFMIDTADALTQTGFKKDWKVSLSKQLQAEKQKFQLMRTNILAELDSQIFRREQENQLKTQKIQFQIEALLRTAKLHRKNRIKQLKEDYQLAKRLHIKTPVEPEKYADKNQSKKTSTKIDINTKNTNIHGYWWGTDILAAEIKRLEERKDLGAFIPEIVQLKQQLLDILNDLELKALKARKANIIPYSKELRDSLAKQRSIENQLNLLDKIHFQTYAYKQPPIEPLKPIKPKKALILAVAGITGLILGIFIALIRGAYKRLRLEEAAA